MKIAWARHPLHECQESFTAADGTAQHRCVKDAGHQSDPTNDDHQCCCGKSDWVTP